jgi:hypothetical protein
MLLTTIGFLLLIYYLFVSNNLTKSEINKIFTSQAAGFFAKNKALKQAYANCSVYLNNYTLEQKTFGNQVVKCTNDLNSCSEKSGIWTCSSYVSLAN